MTPAPKRNSRGRSPARHQHRVVSDEGAHAAVAYQPHLAGYTLAVSFQTVAELREGAVLAGWGAKKRATLHTTLSNLLILHTDDAVCQKWAEVRAVRRSLPIGVADAWIAATALAFNLELVTHNPDDFRAIPGLTVITELKTI